MRKNFAVAAAVVSGSLATPALARAIQCNKTQTHCVTESTNFTVGDRVGIFNSDGELVAVAEVRGMLGEKRALQIEKRTGSIARGDRLALLDDPNTDGPSGHQAYQIYHEPAKTEVGLSLGYASVSPGNGIPGEEVSISGQWRKWGNLSLVARGAFLTMSGSLAHYDGQGFRSETLTAQGFGLLPAVAYETNPSRPVSIRVEAGIGAMQVNSTLGGSASYSDADEQDTKVKNGINLYARWSVGAVYNMTLWHIHADFAESFIDKAIANTLVLGLSRDWR